jgi:hypothetical protein
MGCWFFSWFFLFFSFFPSWEMVASAYLLADGAAEDPVVSEVDGVKGVADGEIVIVLRRRVLDTVVIRNGFRVSAMEPPIEFLASHYLPPMIGEFPEEIPCVIGDRGGCFRLPRAVGVDGFKLKLHPDHAAVPGQRQLVVAIAQVECAVAVRAGRGRLAAIDPLRGSAGLASLQCRDIVFSREGGGRSGSGHEVAENVDETHDGRDARVERRV